MLTHAWNQALLPSSVCETPVLSLTELKRMEFASQTSVNQQGKKTWGFCKMPFWRSSNGDAANNASSASFGQPDSVLQSSAKVYSMAKSFLPTRRKLSLDPPNKLYFPYEPGKQVRSAIRIKNVCDTHIAFKFQTTAPKSCYMRPPGGILAPDESLVATVFKFVEPPEGNEKLTGQKSRVKFKILSLKVKEDVEYVPELFDEHKDQVAIEQILRVVFLEKGRPSPALDKLSSHLAEADSVLESQKKPSEDSSPCIVKEGLIIDEWKERRERYLARQQVKGLGDST